MSIVYETHMEFILDQVHEMEKNHIQEIIDNNQVAQFEYIKKEAGIAGEVADSVIASSKRFAPDSNLTKFIKTNKNARQLIADSVQFKESTRGDGSFTIEIPLLKGE